MINTVSDFAAVSKDFGPASTTLNGQAITGFLVEPVVEDAGISATLSGNALRFHVTGGTVASDPRGQTLVADGVSFTVRDFEVVETMTILQLESV